MTDEEMDKAIKYATKVGIELGSFICWYADTPGPCIICGAQTPCVLVQVLQAKAPKQTTGFFIVHVCNDHDQTSRDFEDMLDAKILAVPLGRDAFRLIEDTMTAPRATD